MCVILSCSTCVSSSTCRRCDRGVFESVPGKQLVFRFGDLEPQISSPPRTTSSPTNVILTPKQVSPTAELPPKKLAVPQSR